MTTHRLYVGSYTQPLPHAPDAHAEGITAFDFDEESGALRPLGLAARATNPSYLAAHPSGRTVYAVHEVPGGQVSAYLAQPGGALTLLGTASTFGSHPAHVSVEPAAQRVWAANYASGASAVAYALQADGALGEHVATLQTQEAPTGPTPHAHCVAPSPDGRHLTVVDLGLDRIVTYERTASQVWRDLTHLQLPTGWGPRHLVVRADGRAAFVTLELASAVAILTRPDASAAWHLAGHTPTQPPGERGVNHPAGLALSADGRFLYVTNRGAENVTVFRVPPDGAALHPVQHEGVRGRTPRACALSPGERHLLVANQDSATITVFRRDVQTGELANPQVVPCPTPTSLCFL